VLGDSFAEGKQVADHQTFPKQLERALREQFPHRRWEVVNGGVSGYGTADEIKFFELFGRAFDPDLVIVEFFVGNDVQNNVASPHFRWHESRLDELPLERPSTRELWVARLQEFCAAHFHLYQFLRDRYHNTTASAVTLEELPYALPVQGFAPTDDGGWRLTEALLDRLLELVDDAGARSLLVAIPQRVQVFDDEWIASTRLEGGDPSRTEPQRRIVAYARQRLLPFLDVLNDLHDASVEQRSYYRIDGHLTAPGHRTVADRILKSLVEFQLLGETR